MADKSYHHGDLREALLTAAEAELDKRGVSGFSLRATAKRAGVSHAAPAHHFGNTHGLLRALSERGFRLLETHMREEQERVKPGGSDEPFERLVAAGLGYLAFAHAHPALFELMFGTAMAEGAGPAKENDAFKVLVEAVAATRGGEEVDWNAVAARWGLVHGLAHLRAAKRMRFIFGSGDDEAALRAVLTSAFGRD